MPYFFFLVSVWQEKVYFIQNYKPAASEQISHLHPVYRGETSITTLLTGNTQSTSIRKQTVKIRNWKLWIYKKETVKLSSQNIHSHDTHTHTHTSGFRRNPIESEGIRFIRVNKRAESFILSIKLKNRISKTELGFLSGIKK